MKSRYVVAIRVVNEAVFEVDAETEAEAVDKAMDAANWAENYTSVESSKHLRSVNKIPAPQDSAFEGGFLKARGALAERDEF